jgi:hypothetical protein
MDTYNILQHQKANTAYKDRWRWIQHYWTQRWTLLTKLDDDESNENQDLVGEDCDVGQSNENDHPAGKGYELGTIMMNLSMN